MARWLVTAPYNAKTIQPLQGHFDGPNQISISNIAAAKILKSPYYWSAPEPYLGNKVSIQKKIGCLPQRYFIPV